MWLQSWICLFVHPAWTVTVACLWTTVQAGMKVLLVDDYRSTSQWTIAQTTGVWNDQWRTSEMFVILQVPKKTAALAFKTRLIHCPSTRRCSSRATCQQRCHTEHKSDKWFSIHHTFLFHLVVSLKMSFFSFCCHSFLQCLHLSLKKNNLSLRLFSSLW